MAEKSLAAMETYLNCHLCSERFTDPVSLGCNHSFCSSCLNKFWDQAKDKNCPVCKRKSSKDHPCVNFSLKALAEELVDSYAAGGGKRARRSEDEVWSSGEKREEEEEVCSKHTVEPKWFCEVEQRVVCHVCESPGHHNHTVVPLEQAVNNLKEKLKSDLQSLQDKRHKYKDVEKTYKKVAQHSKKQLAATEKQIRVEFKKVYQFLTEVEEARLAALTEEEEARLAALREEEEQKRKIISREMKTIQDQISSLTVSISAVEQDIQKENLSFLTSYKHTQTRVRYQVTLRDPQLVSGALIDVAKHLGNLTFRVLETVQGLVKFTPVILDPNTANPWLSLSDDLTSVGRPGLKQNLPDNPERFTKYPAVLGSEGFSSGKHSWEVEVGDHPSWVIGVARESVDRNGKVKSSPAYGLWCIGLLNGDYYTRLNETLSLKRSPQRMSVQLDCDRREVSFYDPEDMTHIYTHKDTFTGKLYPFFEIGKAGDAKHPDVKILQSELSGCHPSEVCA